jgi:hypothetical protein
MSINSNKKAAILLVSALAGMCMAGQTQVPAPIKTYYQQADALLKKMDAPGLEKLTLASHTKDFESTTLPDKSGKVSHRSLPETIRFIKPQLTLMEEFTKVVSHIDNAKNDGDSFVLTISSNISATMKKMRDGLAHKLVVMGTSEDTWVKSGVTWMLKTTKVVSRRVTLDDRVLKM